MTRVSPLKKERRQKKRYININKPQPILHPDLFILLSHFLASMSFSLFFICTSLFLFYFPGHYTTPVCQLHTREVLFLFLNYTASILVPSSPVTPVGLVTMQVKKKQKQKWRLVLLCNINTQMWQCFLTGLRTISLNHQCSTETPFRPFHLVLFSQLPLHPPTPFSVAVFLCHWTLI